MTTTRSTLALTDAELQVEATATALRIAHSTLPIHDAAVVNELAARLANRPRVLPHADTVTLPRTDRLPPFDGVEDAQMAERDRLASMTELFGEPWPMPGCAPHAIAHPHLHDVAHRLVERSATAQLCACIEGLCRGGEVIAGRTAQGLHCKAHLATLEATE